MGLFSAKKNDKKSEKSKHLVFENQGLTGSRSDCASTCTHFLMGNALGGNEDTGSAMPTPTKQEEENVVVVGIQWCGG
jgi:hypothetical protein